MEKHAEILAPAGGEAQLRAAVLCGADAVYLGLRGFNARAGAENFDENTLPQTVGWCHARGVRVYVTLNTLVTDRELPQAAEVLRNASQMGVDAVLVQDWGVLTLAQAVTPDLPIHASTQMSLFTSGGARWAERLGMERVVLARELSRDDIANVCRSCGAEIEVFVHGALCMCYSGQCTMSALIGQRSGNRGACAQPCRLPYGVNSPCRNQFPLSLKDANLSAYLQELETMGVACLKLEGRMKRPEYVAMITAIYRRLIDEKRGPTAAESQALEQAFSRSGFTDGYYRHRKGPAMFGTRPENAPEPKELFSEARKLYENGEHKQIDLSLRATIWADEASTLTASDGVHTVTVTGPVPEAARNRALTAAAGEQAIVLLNRRGYSTFVMCRDCGQTITCPHCAVAMVYHKKNEDLRCHYCGNTMPLPQGCPNCHSRRIKYFGSGTQKAEELLQQLPPIRKLHLEKGKSSLGINGCLDR